MCPDCIRASYKIGLCLYCLVKMHGLYFVIVDYLLVVCESNLEKI